jgi:hypothetical protein
MSPFNFLDHFGVPHWTIVVVVFLLLLVVVRYYSLVVIWLIPEEYRATARFLLNTTDASVMDAQQVLLDDSLSRGVKTRQIAAFAALGCRARFGFRIRSEANEMVARKWLFDHISSLKDMRLSDVPLIMPLALELCFVPSKAELEAKAIMQTAVIRGRQVAYEAAYWDWGVGWFKHPKPVSG